MSRRGSCVEPDLSGAVLCGGASRRMGVDKALLAVRGGPDPDDGTLLARTVRVLSEVAPRVVLACGERPRYVELGLETVLDREPGVGPLAGLAAALDASRTVWLAAVACDLPRLESALVRRLLERARERRADVCLLATEAGDEPLIAVHRVATCAPAVHRAIAAGARRMIAFHDGLVVERLLEQELDPRLRALGVAHNVNTPADWKDPRALGAQERSA